MRKILLLFTALLLCLSGMAEDFRAYKGNIPGGYNYWFYDPEAGQHDPEAHFPLVIFLHGASLCGNNMDKVKKYGPIHAMAKGACISSYIIAPQNPGGSWNPEKIWKIVEWAQQNYAVDATRIYVYGMSLGGYGTIDLAATYPDRIAAAMAICGGGSVRDLSGLSKVPLWIIHGTADKAVKISESERVVKAIEETGDSSRLIFTRLPGVDHGRPARLFYMIQTYDWLFSHSTQDPDREVCRDFDLTVDMLNDAYDDLKDDFSEFE